MRILKAKEKKERSLGTRLDIKPFRSSSPKSAMTRRPYKPGEHGKKRGRGGASEYKLQLMEKQKMKVSYGLSEKQLRKVFMNALSAKSDIIPTIIKQLETRLDNVVYRSRLAPSRIMARQFVSHGHITVNGRKVTIPSYVVKEGDVVSIRESKKNLDVFKELPNILKNTDDAAWLTVDPQKVEVTIQHEPQDIEFPFNINLVIDYYSR